MKLEEHLLSVSRQIRGSTVDEVLRDASLALVEAKELIALLLQNDDLVPIWRRAVKFLERDYVIE